MNPTTLAWMWSREEVVKEMEEQGSVLLINITTLEVREIRAWVGRVLIEDNEDERAKQWAEIWRMAGHAQKHQSGWGQEMAEEAEISTARWNW